RRVPALLVRRRRQGIALLAVRRTLSDVRRTVRPWRPDRLRGPSHAGISCPPHRCREARRDRPGAARMKAGMSRPRAVLTEAVRSRTNLALVAVGCGLVVLFREGLGIDIEGNTFGFVDLALAPGAF